MDKPKLKLGFTDYFGGLDDFFVSSLSRAFDIERDDSNPNYLIFCDETFGQKNKTYDPNKVIKIFYTGENRRPWNYEAHYALSFDHLDWPRHYRLPLYVIENWILVNYHGLKDILEIDRSKNSLLNKTEFCGFVISNGRVKERNDIFHYISQYKQISSAGPHLNNTGYVLPRGMEAPAHKMQYFQNKKFTLCYENGSYPGYVTEKILHGFHCGSVPIYWGSPVVEVDFNPKAYVSRHDFRTDREMLDYIIELDNNDEMYLDMVRQPIFNPRNKVMDIDRMNDWFLHNVYRG